MPAPISNVAAVAVSRSSIDFHMARSIGDCAFSAWIFAIHVAPSVSAILHIWAMRSFGIGFISLRHSLSTPLETFICSASPRRLFLNEC
ncbi:hypothetical protein XF_1885 [Xylella fastidiosa 9a5c]|uniref:Uncharacterized protein n=1 Tax=Xylella fastidiosa (strain 9a5c) TaxID=160492 RepID=Q9PC96_XYLFA|nr:hypothetical protein XF_1885 [Xylella fastidiosa 9a5c]